MPSLTAAPAFPALTNTPSLPMTTTTVTVTVTTASTKTTLAGKVWFSYACVSFEPYRFICKHFVELHIFYFYV